ncbi:thioredoxin fold domain-containing protein [Candidatus Sulfurimonas baltica]|uniref:Thioredoxin fold domain-containing protein n=1 Tax=Candidatus Sulfurimonas baltica TaxID=2740404 RepID=A0A7S7RP82_9BACT|nr:thioredoxin fold domain-containing protein [Candidatus Sulfurimonas baltica]QOY53218.1 thioredoxin fold domain-containing protein [Candidatus Sulfurimonas baltica]
MKLISIILFLCLNVFAIEKPHDLLDSISDHAIRIGNGNSNKIYIFVDPMCPYSKKLITKISEDKMLQLMNSYYIFLYRLPKFESDKLTQHIYQSDDKKACLENVMVNNKQINLDNIQISTDKQKIIDKIATVGKKLNMVHRPYMMVFEEGSNYCRVSEGSAPCMEEFDFE